MDLRLNEPEVYRSKLTLSRNYVSIEITAASGAQTQSPVGHGEISGRQSAIIFAIGPKERRRLFMEVTSENALRFGAVIALHVPGK
jgi:hypothetical protein